MRDDPMRDEPRETQGAWRTPFRLLPVTGPWEELAGLGMEHWFWADSDTEATPPGAHLGGLPPQRPRFATHLWGWGGGRWARIRLDPALPDGLSGALLQAGEGEGEPCAVRTAPIRLRGHLHPLAAAGRVHSARRTARPDTAFEFLELVPAAGERRDTA